MKVAFVVQRYHPDISGGAELHCRWVAEHMSRHWDVEVLTTCAQDYITWKNYYRPGLETINAIPVRRFPVRHPRDPERFGRIQEHILFREHRDGDEVRWLEEEGPASPRLIRFIRKNQAAYDYFIFFSYRYYHSYWGIHTVPQKAVLVPTAEHDPIIYLKLFKKLFRLPRAFIYNSVEERNLIQGLSRNGHIPGLVTGVGSEVQEDAVGARFRKKFGIEGDYILYIGRVDENKGCHRLFDYFMKFREETGTSVTLVLIGSTVLEIPRRPDIRYLGVLPEEDKFDALEGTLLLVMPSFYESLSMVTLEAWAMRKPVLANARCEVLRGQCLRSNGGLFYSHYGEFREALLLLLTDERLRKGLGECGRRYYETHYTWEVIENKYLTILNHLKSETPCTPINSPRP